MDFRNVMYANSAVLRAGASDVVLETRVLVSRRLEDKNESPVCLEHFGLGLEENVLQFFKTFVVILDGIEQSTP